MSIFVRKPSEVATRNSNESLFSPFSSGIMNEMSRFMENMMSRDIFSNPNWLAEGSVFPAINLSETPTEYKISAELPGLKEQDIELQLQDNTLHIKGEKKSETEEKDHNHIRIERSYGQFFRRIPLPARINPEKVEARYRDGVLSVNIAKADDTMRNTRKIDIKQ